MSDIDECLYGNGLLGNSLAPLKEGVVRQKFDVPPFSILNASHHWWRERRKQWHSLGFNSTAGRQENMLKFSNAMQDASGFAPVGEFDPVLCEIFYNWFCPLNGTILDPFSGGSVRGIVATALGFKYIGNDLRQEQVDENRKQALALGLQPIYTCGDSRNFADHINHQKGDFIFSSPPYYYREHYSDLQADLNNAQNYEHFLKGYDEAITSAVSCLKNDRFACFEVAETRDNDGIAPNFVGDTIDCFVAAGALLYNHIIHMKSIASARIRTNMFEKSRKFVPMHEHVLVFIKGDPKKAVKALQNV